MPASTIRLRLLDGIGRDSIVASLDLSPEFQSKVGNKGGVMVCGLAVALRRIARFALLAVVALPTSGMAFPYDAIYVIGDSLSDQGNLFAATRAFAGPANALPDANHYFNGRFSNGPVYTDILAHDLGLPLGPSIAGGNNFAYGGARTNYNAVEQVAGGPFPNGLFPWSLNAEVQAFNARNVHDPNALYIVFSGSNDVGDILSRGLNPATVIPTAVGGIVNAVQAFANAGAKTILVMNIPDLGLTPAFNSLGPPATNPASILSRQFDDALHAALGSFPSALDIIQFQTDDLLTAAVNDPGLFGLTNVTAPCYTGFVVPNPSATECPNPSQYLFWDQVHPTTGVQAILAAAVRETVPEPSAIWLLLPALLAFGIRSRKFPAATGTDRVSGGS
jgi:phospholipase/lecithinase/hemolysin